MNPLDTKPAKNSLAGKGAKTKQHFKPNSNLSGYGKGGDVTSKNKLALPVTRTGSSTGKLVKRTYTDAIGMQGGLRETMKLLGSIKSFCESRFGLKNDDGEVIGYVDSKEEAQKAVSDGEAYSYFNKDEYSESRVCESNPVSDERAAKMIFDKIPVVKGVPPSIPMIKGYVKKYLDMVGKNPSDIDYLASLVFSHVEDMGEGS
jgi:hypothetical protein